MCHLAGSPTSPPDVSPAAKPLSKWADYAYDQKLVDDFANTVKHHASATTQDIASQLVNTCLLVQQQEGQLGMSPHFLNFFYLSSKSQSEIYTCAVTCSITLLSFSPTRLLSIGALAVAVFLGEKMLTPPD